MLPLTRWIGPLFCYCCIFQEKLCVHLKDQYNSVNHSSEAGSILVKSKIAEVKQQLEDNLLSLQRFITQAKTKKKSTSLMDCHLAVVESLCVSVILRTQPAEAQPLAGATKPERSMGRDQTKGSKKRHSDSYFICFSKKFNCIEKDAVWRNLKQNTS